MSQIERGCGGPKTRACRSTSMPSVGLCMRHHVAQGGHAQLSGAAGLTFRRAPSHGSLTVTPTPALGAVALHSLCMHMHMFEHARIINCEEAWRMGQEVGKNAALSLKAFTPAGHASLTITTATPSHTRAATPTTSRSAFSPPPPPPAAGTMRTHRCSKVLEAALGGQRLALRVGLYSPQHVGQ